MAAVRSNRQRVRSHARAASNGAATAVRRTVASVFAEFALARPTSALIPEQERGSVLHAALQAAMSETHYRPYGAQMEAMQAAPKQGPGSPVSPAAEGVSSSLLGAKLQPNNLPWVSQALREQAWAVLVESLRRGPRQQLPPPLPG